MARILLVATATILLLVALFGARAVADEAPAPIHPDEVPNSAFVAQTHDDDGNPLGPAPEVENPDWEKQLQRLKDLCKLIDSDLFELIGRKEHFKQEKALLAKAGNIGAVLEDKFTELKREHHEMTCKEARDVVNHEHFAEFMTSYKNWLAGHESITPVISHAETIRLITLFRDELVGLGLVNDETVAEFNDVLHKMNEMQTLYNELVVDYDHVKGNEENCEPQWKALMKTLEKLHGEHIPDWHHLSEGVKIMLQQCQEDPQLHDGDL